MPTVIPVKFRYAAREAWFDPRDSGAVEADHVVCRTERGLELGLATGDAREVSHRRVRATCGDAPLKPIERVATDEDLERAEGLAARGEAALPTFRRLVDASGLDIKPVGVEWTFGGERVVCYFSSEGRVDFRQLVRELGRELHERVDMRQIGVREEAAVVGGYAHCGQELCCARFGRQFEPVSIRMAKEQDLPLNSTKISGVCGRLMCCLRYEFEAYRDFKSRAPKRNAVIDTPLGTAKIVEYDTPKEQVCLRLENGKQIRVRLADMEASDAARRRAEEIGCACRPDTVTRQALERLQSPDVQMALAELDRASGVASGEAGADVAPSSSRRRRRGDDASSSAEPQPTRVRRRRRRRPEGARDASGGATSTDASSVPTADEGDGQARGRRRRRHHASSTQPTEGQKAASERQDGRTRQVRRRPGDKGGADANRHGATPASADGASQGRRRRRRGGRRRGKGTSDGGSSAAPTS